MSNQDPSVEPVKWIDPSQDEVWSYVQARKLLREKCGATDEEIALWVYHDSLAIYSAEPWGGKHWQEPSNWLWDQDHHASAAWLLAQFRFSRREIEGFDPAAAGRYVSYQQTLERLSSLSDSDPEVARGTLKGEIRAGRLIPFHYVTGGVPWEPEKQASGRFPSLEDAFFKKSVVDSLVKSEFGEAPATPKEAARDTGPAVNQKRKRQIEETLLECERRANEKGIPFDRLCVRAKLEHFHLLLQAQYPQEWHIQFKNYWDKLKPKPARFSKRIPAGESVLSKLFPEYLLGKELTRLPIQSRRTLRE